MKKLFVMLLAVAMLLSLAACGESNTTTTAGNTTTTTTAGEDVTPDVEVMTYAEYIAAEIGAEVVVEVYVQDHQSWWNETITVYAQDTDGGYFIYGMACSEADAANLTAGTKIRVTGTKAEWSGEIEIVDATFEFVEGDSWVAEAKDLTDVLGTDELINYQNQFVCFKGLTIASISYKNGEPGDDIYVDVTLGENTYSFCVEAYLRGTETEVYQAFAELEEGDVVDMEGFLYWYEGVNTHITSVSKVAE